MFATDCRGSDTSLGMVFAVSGDDAGPDGVEEEYGNALFSWAGAVQPILGDSGHCCYCIPEAKVDTTPVGQQVFSGLKVRHVTLLKLCMLRIILLTSLYPVGTQLCACI